MTGKQSRQQLVGDGLTNVREAAAFLGLGRTKVYNLMDTGQLPWVKIGTARRIPRRALIDYATRGLRWGSYEGGSQDV